MPAEKCLKLLEHRHIVDIQSEIQVRVSMLWSMAEFDTSFVFAMEITHPIWQVQSSDRTCTAYSQEKKGGRQTRLLPLKYNGLLLLQNRVETGE